MDDKKSIGFLFFFLKFVVRYVVERAKTRINKGSRGWDWKVPDTKKRQKMALNGPYFGKIFVGLW